MLTGVMVVVMSSFVLSKMSSIWRCIVKACLCVCLLKPC